MKPVLLDSFPQYTRLAGATRVTLEHFRPRKGAWGAISVRSGAALNRRAVARAKCAARGRLRRSQVTTLSGRCGAKRVLLVSTPLRKVKRRAIPAQSGTLQLRKGPTLVTLVNPARSTTKQARVFVTCALSVRRAKTRRVRVAMNAPPEPSRHRKEAQHAPNAHTDRFNPRKARMNVLCALKGTTRTNPAQ